MMPKTEGKKLRAKDKLAKIPVKIEKNKPKRKPDWFKIDLTPNPKVNRIRKLLREKNLSSVCEEASCPNLAECFGNGTATFMIMGDKCTRRCAFCDVAHGYPDPLDAAEPENLAETVSIMGLTYVVITSVDRDDLKDGGAAHFAACIRAVRAKNPETKVEVLVPDFRGRLDKALAAMATDLPDVFNHNIETAPSLYRQARPGSDYQWSLNLLKQFKADHPEALTKSGLMVGLGETDAEVDSVLQDLRAHDVDIVTIGQYLQPSSYHMPVDRFVAPEQFEVWAARARALGFYNVASGPMVRSSYHADEHAKKGRTSATS